MNRTLIIHSTGKISKSVLLKGWIHSVRQHGGITFFDLRDRSGLVQVVVENLKVELKPESVITVTGKVVKRPEKLVNSKLKTGTVEIKAEKIKVLSKLKIFAIICANSNLFR